MPAMASAICASATAEFRTPPGAVYPLHRAGDVADLEFRHRHPCWCVTQTADFDNLSANYSLVAAQLLPGLRRERGFFLLLCGWRG